MADTQNTQTEATEKVERPPVPAGFHRLDLKSTGTEYPARFGGLSIEYPILQAVPKDVHATVDAFVRDFVAPDVEDPAVVVAEYLNGYGLTYRRNGVVKRVLSQAKPDEDAETVLARALEQVQADRIGTPRAKGEGGGGKVAKAEAKATAAVNTTLEMYRQLRPADRKRMRDMILASGAVTAEQLDAIDNEA